MKHSILLSTISFLALSTSAQAADWNVDIFAGKTFSGTHDFSNGFVRDTDNGNTFGLAFSKSNVFAKNLEFGVEFSHQVEEFTGFPNTQGIATSLLATAKYNFVNAGAFEAYAGLGLGVTHIKVETASGSLGAAGQVSLGARYAVSSNVKLFAEARYFSTFGDIDVSALPVVTTNYDNTSVIVGLRTSF